MKTYLIFGIRAKDIDSIVRVVQKAIGVRFNAHESSFLGEYYRADIASGGDITLQFNYNNVECEWAEPAHKDYDILLYANDARDPASLEAALRQHATLLSREDL
jgi:hypothetical protein